MKVSVVENTYTVIPKKYKPLISMKKYLGFDFA